MDFIGYIGQDEWIGDITPDPMDDDFVLLQSGGVILLQDGHGLLLEAA